MEIEKENKDSKRKMGVFVEATRLSNFLQFLYLEETISKSTYDVMKDSLEYLHASASR